MLLPHPRVKVSIVRSLRDLEVACSASDRQGSNFESCVWRTVSSQSSHHPQEVLLVQFSLYVHKGGLKPDSFHFIWKKCYVTFLLSLCPIQPSVMGLVFALESSLTFRLLTANYRTDNRCACRFPLTKTMGLLGKNVRDCSDVTMYYSAVRHGPGFCLGVEFNIHHSNASIYF